MEIRIDNQGIALPDCYAMDYVAGKLKAGKDIHTSNEWVFQVARVLVRRIPIEQRPKITWIGHGHILDMDDDMRFDWPKEMNYNFNLLIELV